MLAILRAWNELNLKEDIENEWNCVSVSEHFQSVQFQMLFRLSLVPLQFKWMAETNRVNKARKKSKRIKRHGIQQISICTADISFSLPFSLCTICWGIRSLDTYMHSRLSIHTSTRTHVSLAFSPSGACTAHYFFILSSTAHRFSASVSV